MIVTHSSHGTIRHSANQAAHLIFPEIAVEQYCNDKADTADNQEAFLVSCDILSGLFGFLGCFLYDLGGIFVCTFSALFTAFSAFGMGFSRTGSTCSPSLKRRRYALPVGGPVQVASFKKSPPVHVYFGIVFMAKYQTETVVFLLIPISDGYIIEIIFFGGLAALLDLTEDRLESVDEKMGYRILLFDLDDTLLDFGANEMDSLNKLFQQHGFSFSDELFRVYNSVNKQLWADYENGAISLEHVLNARFSDTMLRLGTVVDGLEWENQYRELLGNGCQLIDGALELCQGLSVSHRLFVVTNGITKTQIKRLKQSGLYTYFEDIFDSQSIGFQKPSKKIFDYVICHITDFNTKEALIIGDSLNTDIKGGLVSGIDTCWINRKAQKCSAEIISTYTITSLAELHDICAN